MENPRFAEENIYKGIRNLFKLELELELVRVSNS